MGPSSINGQFAVEMLKFFFASAFLAFVLASPYPSSKSAEVPPLNARIIGGKPNTIFDFPYLISLESSNFYLCGGAIIHRQYVLTTASCARGNLVPDLPIRAGSNNRLVGGIIVQVAAIHEHPDYDSLSMDNDIAVLQLASPLTFGDTIAAIDLPDQDEVVLDDVDAQVSGWGYLTEILGFFSILFRTVTVRTVSLDDCRAAYGASLVTDNMICAGVPGGGKGPCYGDGGAPLVIDNQLVGLFSWSYGCGRPGFPSVYTRISAVRDFINQTTGI